MGLSKLSNRLGSIRGIAAGMVTADYGAASITGAKISNLTVTGAKVSAGAMIATKLATNAVIAAKISNLTITGAKVSAGAMIAAKLATDSVTAVKISNLTVTGAKVSAGAMIAAKLATDSVTAVKISSLTITGAKISAGAIVPSKITAYAYQEIPFLFSTATSGDAAIQWIGHLRKDSYPVGVAFGITGTAAVPTTKVRLDVHYMKTSASALASTNSFFRTGAKASQAATLLTYGFTPASTLTTLLPSTVMLGIQKAIHGSDAGTTKVRGVIIYKTALQA